MKLSLNHNESIHESWLMFPMHSASDGLAAWCQRSASALESKNRLANCTELWQNTRHPLNTFKYRNLVLLRFMIHDLLLSACFSLHCTQRLQTTGTNHYFAMEHVNLSECGKECSNLSWVGSYFQCIWFRLGESCKDQNWDRHGLIVTRTHHQLPPSLIHW